jgi:hydroxymethylpyrimidine kinase/phosphomethylpyrimidine kinase
MKENNVWIISALDPLGRSGALVDYDVVKSLDAEPTVIITALTAQNHSQIYCVNPVDVSVLQKQFEALLETQKPTIIKLGMLADRSMIECLVQLIDRLKVPVVLDTVLDSSSAGALLSPSAFDLFCKQMIPRASLIMTNRHEAEALTGETLSTAKDYPLAANYLLELGAGAVMIKDGHGEGNATSDYFATESQAFWLQTPRLDKTVKGFGCCLASALAASYTHLDDWAASAFLAVAYTQRAIRLASSKLHVNSWPVDAEDLALIFHDLEMEAKDLATQVKEVNFPLQANAKWIKEVFAHPCPC